MVFARETTASVASEPACSPGATMTRSTRRLSTMSASAESGANSSASRLRRSASGR
jgi:hypothetical protein